MQDFLNRYLLIVLILLAAFALRALDLQQYPPGVSRDEAINVVDGVNIARSGNLPLYEEGWSRPEPSYRMLLAVGAYFFGPSVWALRLITVFVHLLALAATGWMTAQILNDLPAPLRRWGLIAALAFMAVMMTHISISRALYRAPLLLLCSALSAGFVLRGLRTGRWRDFTLSGLFAGLNLYTYTAAWVFPGAFFALGAALLLFRWSTWRVWMPRLLLLAVVAVLVMLPVLLLAIQHPSAVLARTQDVTGGNLATDTMLRLAIGQFFTAGDENPQYNAASQPLVPLLLLPFFLLGLLALLLRIRMPSSLFVLALLLLFNLPAIISEEITHGLRIAGEFIVVPAVAAIGLVFVLRLLPAATRAGRWTYTALGAGFLLLSAITGIQHWQIMTDFFDRADQWRQWRVYNRELDHNEWFFRTDRRDFAAWLAAQDTPLLIPLEEIARETTQAWLYTAYPASQMADERFQLPPQTRLVIPWSLERSDLIRDTRQFALLDQGTITLLHPFSAATQQALLAGIERATPITRAGQIDLLGYEQPIAADFMLEYEPVNQRDQIASFGDGEVLLRRWYGSATFAGTSGETLEFTPVWEPQRRIGHDYFALLQLQTQNFERITGTDVHLLRWVYPSSIWQAGDQVAETIPLTLPVDLPPGAYRLVTGLYFADYPPIPAQSLIAESQPDTATIAWLKVPLPPVTAPEQPALDIQFADQVALTHIALQQSGDQWMAVLYWRGLQARPEFDATIFVHLIDSDGTIIAQHDARPHNGQYPTFIWDQGEVIRTEHPLGAVDLQNLALRIGMYIFPGPVNLPAGMNGSVLPDGLVLPGVAVDFIETP